MYLLCLGRGRLRLASEYGSGDPLRAEHHHRIAPFASADRFGSANDCAARLEPRSLYFFWNQPTRDFLNQFFIVRFA